ncbi:MAG TPA: histidine phosphatase family protein [Nocardioides sp.]|nr:histidine phosphatase family protein [Nocardioides sp.]
MRSLHLVRHARSRPDPVQPPERWPLDPAGFADLQALAASDRVPLGAPTYSSPEPKALATAHVLAHPNRPVDPAQAHRCGCDAVTVVGELVEHRRRPRWFPDPADFRDAVRRAFADPLTPAVPEWEPLGALRDRLLPATRRLVDRHRETDVVLVGHGTAWTLLVSELSGTAPDLEAWAMLRMPDVWTLTLP